MQREAAMSEQERAIQAACDAYDRGWMEQKKPSFSGCIRAAVAAYDRALWSNDMAAAPTDGTPVHLYAPPYDGLPSMQTITRYHPDGGWCIDELRQPTHWRPCAADLEE